jgi:hypothetical protein
LTLSDEFTMNPTRYLSEEELIERGLEALMATLGPVEAMRFLTLPRPHRLESVERHQKWQANLDQEQSFDQIFGVKPANQ